MLLEKKNAVIYGAGGDVGSAIAQAFAREGARVFLAGRTLSKLDAVAQAVSDSGGMAQTAQVDVLDEQAVEAFTDSVVRSGGSIDICMNATNFNYPGSLGKPLIELSLENFTDPITAYTKAYFLTARAAARRMVEKRSGVIVTLTANPARVPIPFFGGLAPSWAMLEAITRSFAVELGPLGIRVIGMRSDAIPETTAVRNAYSSRASLLGLKLEDIVAQSESKTLLQRLPTLAEVANTAAFLASDQARAMTATVANLSCGSLVE
ncbi:SDR family oxidoreductase [Ktedonosporobacter rubrisoli]|uniref:SDR family oxidoreductase n=1 Tax=Ktedonosporobacter rubrisoli TaxID=2509675 RepID=A0A4P6JP30_KTERU|nr:SDR family oxidoreductase [Ktedonosporobacter rubrisoli]QBD77109.1 SDR family oxidoreductase [Ktedonosporobacter rubrisoli]